MRGSRELIVSICDTQLLHWASCRDDCSKALECDSLNAKANYLLGMSQKHLSQFDAAIAAFHSALQVAEKASKSKAFQSEILVELRRAKKAKWLHLQEESLERHRQVRSRLADLFAQKAAHAGNDHGATHNIDSVMAYVEEMATKYEQSMTVTTIPEYFICPVSMDIMHEPVCTPNGVS